jgi:hypothetical protein
MTILANPITREDIRAIKAEIRWAERQCHRDDDRIFILKETLKLLRALRTIEGE